jgi:protein ImuA
MGIIALEHKVNMLPCPVSPAPGFAGLSAAMARQPLHEVGASEPGAEAAALGFTLALAASWAGAAHVFWAGEEGCFAEDGGPYPPGLAGFGVDLTRLTVIRAARRDDALWAAEQALSASGAVVICALGRRGRPLDLKATRRLLLFAERARSRCLLLRPCADASAAWTRWRVNAAPSLAPAREIGPPAFSLELVRSRTGPAGARFIVEWNAHERALTERVVGGASAALAHGSADPYRARA